LWDCTISKKKNSCSSLCGLNSRCTKLKVGAKREE
jgi:hypothetical protein